MEIFQKKVKKYLDNWKIQDIFASVLWNRKKNNAEADYAYGVFEMLWNISGAS